MMITIIYKTHKREQTMNTISVVLITVAPFDIEV